MDNLLFENRQKMFIFFIEGRIVDKGGGYSDDPVFKNTRHKSKRAKLT